MLRQRWGGIENLLTVALVRIRSQILVLTPPCSALSQEVLEPATEAEDSNFSDSGYSSTCSSANPTTDSLVMDNVPPIEPSGRTEGRQDLQGHAAQQSEGRQDLHQQAPCTQGENESLEE